MTLNYLFYWRKRLMVRFIAALTLYRGSVWDTIKRITCLMQAHGWRCLKYKTQRCFNPSLLSEVCLFLIVIPFHMWTFSCNLTLSGRPSYKWVYRCSKMELVFTKRGAHSWHIKNADGFEQFIRFSRGRYIVIYSTYSPSCYNLERVDFSELRHNVIFSWIPLLWNLR